jgi:hypothetical protein
VSTGDIVIIPPGVYHGFDEVTDHVEYVAVRPDPEHVLPPAGCIQRSRNRKSLRPLAFGLARALTTALDKRQKARGKGKEARLRSALAACGCG